MFEGHISSQEYRFAKSEPAPWYKYLTCTQYAFLTSLSVFYEDSSGWDGGRINGFVNGYHDNRTNGGFGGRGPPRNDRGGRGAYRGNRGGGSFNQPMQNAGVGIGCALKYQILTLAVVSL